MGREVGRGKNMIDEDRTMQLYGYTSDELSPHSAKLIIAVCEECGKYRVLKKYSYKDLCKSCSRVGAVRTVESKLKMSKARIGTQRSLEFRREMSARQQGIPLNDWEGFAQEHKYCYQFNNGCRERNRDRYGRACFLCGKNERDNGQRLSVHHVDMNKDQGCDNHEWKLVPLCRSCHNRIHNQTWQARIEYLLNIINRSDKI